jgi:uncharacterized peroxidase-related enzyme
MFIAPPGPSGDRERCYAASTASQGFVMNLTQAWAWRPDVFDGFAALRNQLTSNSSLSKRDQAVIVCATAAALGDSYCALAWGKTLVQEAGDNVAAAVIGNTGLAALPARDAALAAWVRKVVTQPNDTTAADVQALRDAGFNDREVFEVTAFAAFRIAFSTVNDALGIRPDWQLAQALAPEVRARVDFGRPVASAP